VDAVEAYRKALEFGLEAPEQNAVLHELVVTLVNREDYAAALEMGSCCF